MLGMKTKSIFACLQGLVLRISHRVPVLSILERMGLGMCHVTVTGLFSPSVDVQPSNSCHVHNTTSKSSAQSIQTLQMTFSEARRTSSPHEDLNTCILRDTQSSCFFSNCCSSDITGQINTLRKRLSGPGVALTDRRDSNIILSSHRARTNLLFQTHNHRTAVVLSGFKLLIS